MRLGECDSVHSWRELSILVRDTRRQPGETQDPLTRAHGLLKKRDLNKARHECRGYSRGSKARRVFPSTLSPCLGFSRQECTAGRTLCWLIPRLVARQRIETVQLFPLASLKWWLMAWHHCMVSQSHCPSYWIYPPDIWLSICSCLEPVYLEIHMKIQFALLYMNLCKNKRVTPEFAVQAAF